MIDELKARYWRWIGSAAERRPILRHPGYCPACSRDVMFVARNAWLRDHYRCSNCDSIPRERALMVVIERYFPNWRRLTIHESSPADRGTSRRFARDCPRYVASQFFPGVEAGGLVGDVRCESLEALTFPDASIDLHVTQDVLEHVHHPSTVFREIARTLKPGGAHVFTTPLVNKDTPSKRRTRIGEDGHVSHLEPPMYHGNPISAEGSLVTVDWGYDICQAIFESCGLFTHLVYIDDSSMGIRAEYIEVLVTIKPSVADRPDPIL